MSELPKLYDRESEQALIGCILIDPNSLDDIAGDLAPSAFYLHSNRFIFEAVVALRAADKAVDFITVIDELERTGKLTSAGGAAYMTECIEGVPNSLHASSYAQVVIDKASRRRLLELAQVIGKAVYDPQSDLDTLRADTMAELASGAGLAGGAQPVSVSLDILYDQIKDASENPTAIFGIPTGFADFDNITAGLQATEMMVLAGEPGTGKSLLAAQMASNMAQANRPGVIYELEMGHVQLTRRMIAAMSGVPTKALKAGKIQDAEWRAITDAFSKANQWPLYISDYTGWTTTALRSDLARLKKQAGIEWFVVDYFGLLQDQGGDDENEREKRMSGAIKRVCKDLDLSAIVIHSMNKVGMAAPVKRLQHLSGSNRLAFDADVVCFLTSHIPTGGEPENKNVRTLTFAKYREDDTNRLLHLVKRAGLPAFGDYTPDPTASIKAAVNAKNGVKA